MVIKEVYLSNEKFPIALFSKKKLPSRKEASLCVHLVHFFSQSSLYKDLGRFLLVGKQWIVIINANDYVFSWKILEMAAVKIFQLNKKQVGDCHHGIVT